MKTREGWPARERLLDPFFFPALSLWGGGPLRLQPSARKEGEGRQRERGGLQRVGSKGPGRRTPQGRDAAPLRRGAQGAGQGACDGPHWQCWGPQSSGDGAGHEKRDRERQASVDARGIARTVHSQLPRTAQHLYSSSDGNCPVTAERRPSGHPRRLVIPTVSTPSKPSSQCRDFTLHRFSPRPRQWGASGWRVPKYSCPRNTAPRLAVPRARGTVLYNVHSHGVSCCCWNPLVRSPVTCCRAPQPCPNGLPIGGGAGCAGLVT